MLGNMERVKGKYDGEKIILEGPLQNREPGEVVVIFQDNQKEVPSVANVTGRTIARFLDGNPSFDFLNDPEEDIYTDKDLKIKYS